MSTAGQVVDRVLREWLYAPDDQPSMAALNSPISAVSPTVPLDARMLAPDEADLLAPGIVVEAGTELMLVVDVEDPLVLTVRRGHGGTTAVAHDTDDLVTIAPSFTRWAVFEAICDGVEGLYPTLWRQTTDEVTVSQPFTELAAEAVTLVGFRFQHQNIIRNGTAGLLTEFPPSGTGQAFTSSAPDGSTGWITYRGRFPRPTTLDDELSDLGVRSHWERIVAVGAVAQVIAGREPEQSTMGFISEQLHTEAYPVGSASQQRDSLMLYQQQLLDEARRELISEHQPNVTVFPAW